jgi:hypothetical protein
MPEFEMSKAVSKVVLAGVWEKQVEKESSVAKKVASLLDLDEGVYPEVGSSLVDEDGSMFFFVGIHKDKKHFVLQDEDGAAVLLLTADFEAYDMPVSSAAPEEEELDLDMDDEDELELDLDEDDSDADGEDEDGVDDESGDDSEDPLEGMDEKSIAKLLKKKWTRAQMEQYLDDYFELDDEEIETISELSDDELADYVANYCAAADNAADEEEEEESDEDDDSGLDEDFSETDEDEDEDSDDSDEEEEEESDEDSDEDEEEESDEDSDEDEEEESDEDEDDSDADEEEEEEEEESDEDDESIDADYINGLSGSELATFYNENKQSLPPMPKAIRNQTDKKKRKAALAAWLIENLVEEDTDTLGLDEDEFGDDE